MLGELAQKKVDKPLVEEGRNGNAVIIMTTVLLAALAFGQRAINRHIRERDVPFLIAPEQDAFRWNPKLFEILSFSNLAVAVDWMWIRVLQEDSLTHVLPGQRAVIFYDIDLITDIDPRFQQAFTSGSNLLVVVRDDAASSLDLLLKGNFARRRLIPKHSRDFIQRYWSRPFQIPLILAYVYMFELRDIVRAKEAFIQAADAEGSPVYLQSLKKRFLKLGGEYEVGLRLLKFMMEENKDTTTRAKLSKQYFDLQMAQAMFFLNHEFEEYRKKARTRNPQRLWERFKKEKNVAETDPAGGRIYLDETGKAATTTEYKSVFGLK